MNGDFLEIAAERMNIKMQSCHEPCQLASTQEISGQPRRSLRHGRRLERHGASIIKNERLCTSSGGTPQDGKTLGRDEQGADCLTPNSYIQHQAPRSGTPIQQMVSSHVSRGGSQAGLKVFVPEAILVRPGAENVLGMMCPQRKTTVKFCRR